MSERSTVTPHGPPRSPQCSTSVEWGRCAGKSWSDSRPKSTTRKCISPAKLTKLAPTSPDSRSSRSSVRTQQRNAKRSVKVCMLYVNRRVCILGALSWCPILLSLFLPFFFSLSKSFSNLSFSYCFHSLPVVFAFSVFTGIISTLFPTRLLHSLSSLA